MPRVWRWLAAFPITRAGEMNMNATRSMKRNVTRRGVALVVVALLASLSLLTACGSTSSSASLPPREPPSGEHQLTAEDVNAWLDGTLPDALKNGDIPGAVVTVVHQQQKDLRRHPKSLPEVLDLLERQGLAQSMAALRTLLLDP